MSKLLIFLCHVTYIYTYFYMHTRHMYMHCIYILLFFNFKPPRTHSKHNFWKVAFNGTHVCKGSSPACFLLVWSNRPELTHTCPVGLLLPSSQWFGVVEPPRTHSNLLCKPASPFVTVVRGCSVWSNRPELNRTCPVRGSAFPFITVVLALERLDPSILEHSLGSRPSRSVHALIMRIGSI